MWRLVFALLVCFASVSVRQASAEEPVGAKPPGAGQAPPLIYPVPSSQSPRLPSPALIALEHRGERNEKIGKILVGVGAPVGIVGGIVGFYYLSQVPDNLFNKNSDAGIGMYAGLGVCMAGLAVTVAGIIAYAAGDAQLRRAARMRSTITPVFSTMGPGSGGLMLVGHF